MKQDFQGLNMIVRIEIRYKRLQRTMRIENIDMKVKSVDYELQYEVLIVESGDLRVESRYQRQQQ